MVCVPQMERTIGETVYGHQGQPWYGTVPRFLRGFVGQGHEARDGWSVLAKRLTVLRRNVLLSSKV